MTRRYTVNKYSLRKAAKARVMARGWCEPFTGVIRLCSAGFNLTTTAMAGVILYTYVTDVGGTS